MIETLYNEEVAKQAANKILQVVNKILIDGSNYIAVTKEIRDLLSDKSLGRAKVIAAEALGEKRVARAMEWFQANDFNYDEAFFTLAFEFVHKGTEPIKTVAKSIFDEAFRRMGRSIS